MRSLVIGASRAAASASPSAWLTCPGRQSLRTRTCTFRSFRIPRAQGQPSRRPADPGGYAVHHELGRRPRTPAETVEPGELVALPRGVLLQVNKRELLRVNHALGTP